MKKLFNNLPFRLLLGIIIGVILGQVFPESVMKVIVTLQYIMGQLITFCVPLIIIGFIAPCRSLTVCPSVTVWSPCTQAAMVFFPGASVLPMAVWNP